VHPSLAVCEEKIKRAETHLDELHHELRTFFERDEPYEIPGKYDPQTKRFTFYFSTRDDPPPILDILVGETAHALRSSLNNLVSALSGGSYGDTDFPIFVSKPDFRKYGRPRISRLPKTKRDAIEALQPYHRTDPAAAPLAILNRLAREDKHRAATFRIAAFINADMHFDAVRDIAGYGEVIVYSGRMENGDPLADVEIIPEGPQPELHINCKVRADIAFGEGWLLPEPFPAVIEEVRDIVAKLPQ
jgi:hypothetical protein